MLWLLLLHISAVLCWCGSLLYLPALIASTASQKTAAVQQHYISAALLIYKFLMTPAALIAITSGTVLFTLGEIVDTWLVLKLTLVVILVICHALSGWVILLTQKMPDRNVILPCMLLAIAVVPLILIIIGIVLTKPF